MKIAFHLTIPAPPQPELDAAIQEINQLRAAFGGDYGHLYPARNYHRWLPRRWLRRRPLERLLRLDRQIDIHHVASDQLFAYRAFTRLRRPLVLRLMTSPTTRPRALEALHVYRAVVVSSAVDARRLEAWGLHRVEVIPPGLDLARFRSLPAPPKGPFTVVMASAPWTRRQFVSKGVQPLLEALRARPQMRLVLLWRGMLAAEIDRRVRAAKLEDRVEVIHERVDPAAVLRRAHAAILVTSSPRVVKAFPHSLLEALAAGRPIITNPELGIAALVRENGCGELAFCTANAIGGALDRLAEHYSGYRAAARSIDLGAFTVDSYLTAYRALYTTLIAGR